MTDELVEQLTQLQRYAAGLRNVIADAQAVAPARAEGEDRGGAVRVTLGPDGLPESIRVKPDWNRRIAPQAFGGAVMDAFRAASNARMAEWTKTLEDERWAQKVQRLRSELERPQAGAPAAATVPPAFRRDVSNVKPRPLDVVAEDVMKALDTAQDVAARPATPAAGVGKAAAGRLVITLAGGGLASCVADPDWVSQQTAARLGSALSEALAGARERLAAAERSAGGDEADERKRHLTRLFDEALAHINDTPRS